MGILPQDQRPVFPNPRPNAVMKEEQRNAVRIIPVFNDETQTISQYVNEEDLRKFVQKEIEKAIKNLRP